MPTAKVNKKAATANRKTQVVLKKAQSLEATRKKKAATEKLRVQGLLKKVQALETKKKQSLKDATRLHHLRTRKVPKDV